MSGRKGRSSDLRRFGAFTSRPTAAPLNTVRLVERPRDTGFQPPPHLRSLAPNQHLINTLRSKDSMSSASSSRRPSATGVPQTKVRASALRDYYGLAASEDPTTPTASSSAAPLRPSDPLDADSSDFDAAKALKVLSQSASLAQLMSRESELLVEIRELDGERQSLVYNHHHELVAASETIRKVSRCLLALHTMLFDQSSCMRPLAIDENTSRRSNALAGPATEQSSAHRNAAPRRASSG